MRTDIASIGDTAIAQRFGTAQIGQRPPLVTSEANARVLMDRYERHENPAVTFDPVSFGYFYSVVMDELQAGNFERVRAVYAGFLEATQDEQTSNAVWLPGFGVSLQGTKTAELTQDVRAGLSEKGIDPDAIGIKSLDRGLW